MNQLRQSRQRTGVKIYSILVCSVLLLLPAYANAEVLADSGYPTAGANAERNYKINRSVSTRPLFLIRCNRKKIELLIILINITLLFIYVN